MAMNVASVGLRPIAAAGATTPVNIDAATALVLPTTAQRRDSAGVLECTIVVTGTVTSRYTTNGVVPTAAVGLLLAAPSATVPVSLTLRGEELIAAFRIIGTAAGNAIAYQFAVLDNR